MANQAPTPPSNKDSPVHQHLHRAFTFQNPTAPSAHHPSPPIPVLPSPDPSEDGLRRHAQDRSFLAGQIPNHAPTTNENQVNLLKRLSNVSHTGTPLQKRRSLDVAVSAGSNTAMPSPPTLRWIPHTSAQHHSPLATTFVAWDIDQQGQDQPSLSTAARAWGHQRAPSATSDQSPSLTSQMKFQSTDSPPISEYYMCAQAGQQELLNQLTPGKQPPLVQARIRTLLEAIKCEDVSFLFLHQVVCMACCHPGRIPPKIKALQSFQPIIKFLGSLLGDPERLQNPTLEFFAAFPQALHIFAQRSPQDSESLTASLSLFFGIMYRAGFHFLSSCTTKSFLPPTAEIYFYTGAKSTTLRTVLWRHLARTIWARSLPEKEVLELLHQTEPFHRQDQAAFHQRRAQRLSDMSDEEKRAVTVIQELAATMMERRNSISGMQSPSMLSSNNLPTASQGLSRIDTDSPTSTTSFSGPASSILPSDRTLRAFAASPMMHAPVANSTRQYPGFERSIYPQAPYTTTQVAQPQPTHAMHQLWCRSPPPGLSGSDDGKQSGPPSKDLCQVISSFTIPPQSLRANEIIHAFKFMIDEEGMNRIYKDSITPEGRIKRHYRAGMRQLRVKMTNKVFSPELKADTKMIPSHEWVVADCSWPPNVLIEVNQKPLELRRKLQWSKDLPADITGNNLQGERYLQLGENTVEVLFTSGHADPSIENYSFAIEEVEAQPATVLKVKCRKKTQPTAKTLSVIERKLGTDDDDEVRSVGGTITLDLFEPFTTSKIFDVPVRSIHCQHLDCFDLDTFIDARYRRKPGYPTAIDDWRCPLCRVDARPQNLVIDEFFVDIRKTLAETGRLDTRYVTVKADGEWEPKQMKEKESTTGGRKPDAKVATATLSKVVEVIELDDD